MGKHRIIWNGVEYQSVTEAAQALGISKAAMQQRIAKGYTSDTDLKPKPKRPITWNNIHYPSMTAAARELGIDVSVVKYRADNGFTSDEDLKSAPSRRTIKRRKREQKKLLKNIFDASKVFQLEPHSKFPPLMDFKLMVITDDTVSDEEVAAAWAYALRYSAKALDLPDYDAAIQLMAERHPSWKILRAIPIDANLSLADKDTPE